VIPVLWVAAGGALGSVARYAVVTQAAERGLGDFPWGTLAVNLIGCLLIGLLAAGLAGVEPARQELKFFLVVGFLGGFTTFSSFGLETLGLIQEKEFVSAAIYVLASNLGGLALAALGFRLAS